MPYLDNWDEFTEKTRVLYEKDPVNWKMSMKYRHNDGKLVVKATDNKKTYLYSTDQPKELKNIDKLFSVHMSSMTQ